MWKTRILAAAVAAVALGGMASVFAAVRHDLDDRFARDRAEERNEHAREARLALPRTASGAIDVPKLIVELRAAITRGTRDIRFRDAALSAEDVKTLRELAARFGFERLRVREEGQRVRVDFRNEDRDEFRERRELRDRDGDRDDFRKRVGREEGRPERVEKVMRAERPDKAERNERAERPERHERGERPDRSGRH